MDSSTLHFRWWRRVRVHRLLVLLLIWLLSYVVVTPQQAWAQVGEDGTPADAMDADGWGAKDVELPLVAQASRQALTDLSGALVTLPQASYSYTGDAIAPLPTVTLAGKELIRCVDYDYGYTNNVTVGTATLNVKGIGNYSGTATLCFKIKAASIAGAGVTVGATSYPYTGAAIRPTVTVRLAGRQLSQGSDYTVAYKDNVSTGTATVTVTGKGSYCDSASGTFRVVPLSLASAAVTLSKTGYVYTGAACEPVPTVRIGGKTLVCDVDYSVTYKGNVSAGTATVTVKGKGNYAGSASKSFGIAATSLATATVTLPKASYPYTGRGIEPLPTVTLGGKVLERNQDYALTYRNNTAIGAATVTVTGKHNYRNSVTKTFAIKVASLSSASVYLPQSNYSYTGAKITPVPTVHVEGRRLVAGTDYEITYGGNTHRGPGSVTVSGRGNYTGTKTALFRIDPITLAPARVSLGRASYVYSGEAVKPVPTVMYGKKTLVAGSDYVVSYRGNAAVGTATVVVTGKGDYSGTASKTFSITAASIASATVTFAKGSYDYTGGAIEPIPTVTLGGRTLKRGTDFSYAFKNNVKKGTATVTITGKGNYRKSVTARFKISAAPISSAKVTLPKSRYSYTGKALRPIPSVSLGGRKLVSGTDYTVSYANNTRKGTATVSIKGKGNYAGAVSATFKIA